MTVFAIAQVTVTDRAAYDRYQSRFLNVFRQFQGRLLAADERPCRIEGQWSHDKVVLMSFPDAPAFHAWARSPAYRKISADREAGAQVTVVLVTGLDQLAEP